jgi:hypothetical protein
VVALWGAAFCLSCGIASRTFPTSTDGAAVSFAAAVLGESRRAVSAHLYGTADTYFHRGVPHVHEKAFTDSWFQRIAGEISPEAHQHREGHDTKEIMPWLSLATKMDPGNVEVYRVAAFWLAGEVGRPDLAEQVLREAQQNNPGSYEVQLDRSRLMLGRGDSAGAMRTLNAALAFWPSNLDPGAEDALLEKAEILLYQALLLEQAGDTLGGLRKLRGILQLFPGRASVRHRADLLAAGTPPAVPASKLLKDVVERHQKARFVCQHEEHQDHEDHEGHEH